MSGTQRPGSGTWAEWLVRVCLRVWPRGSRDRDGPALLETIRDELADRTERGRSRWWWMLAECGSIVRAGFALRVAGLRAAIGDATRDWLSDARFAARTLVRNRGFSVFVMLTLAIGIGGNAAIFGLVDQTLFRPAPYESPDELVLVWSTLGQDPARVPVAAPDVAVFRERSRRFESFAFMNRVRDGAIGSEAATGVEHVRIATVTPNFFELLGIRPVLGRVFAGHDIVSSSRDDGALTAPVVVLSHRTWRSVFGADPGVVGQVVRLNGWPVTLLGVLPALFRLELPPDAGIATDADVWSPLQVPLIAFRRGDGRLLDQDSDNSGVAIGRVRTGVSLDEAVAELSAIGDQLRHEVPAYTAAGLRVSARSMHEDATAHASGLLRALLAGAGIVLLVACLNLSTLVLARGMRRHAELAIRTALGSSRMRILRQLVTENLLLVAVGGGFAAMVAAFGTELFARTLPPGLLPNVALRWDPLGVLLATAVTAAVVLAFGILPTLGIVMHEQRGRIGGVFQRTRGRTMRMRHALVLSEVALSVVLVSCAAFLIRTTFELRAIRPGFESANALTFSVSLRVPGRYTGPAERARFMREVETAIRDLPGVRAVGLTGGLPLSGRRWTQPYGLPGQAQPEWQENRADFRVITSGWFEAVGARVLEGRAFTHDEDLIEDRRVVIVDEKLARRIVRGGSAVGATVGFPLDGQPIHAEVVGVVEHIRHDELTSEGREALYVPYRQEASRDVSFVLRTEGDPAALAPAIRGTLRAIDPEVPVYALRTMDEYVDDALSPTRFALVLLAGFAVLTLLASGLGLHGVIAYEVGSRTREIGLRMAIGASAQGVMRSVLLSGVRLGGAGVLIGAALATIAARLLQPLVYGVETADPLTWAMVLSAVLAVTLLSCWVSALRASRLDPALALRAD
ncbi:MAG: ABC transporter permease [Gemmatimonadetes bacterium]|nr:ABC transporter permease [Gemmatimonadota bacterium]